MGQMKKLITITTLVVLSLLLIASKQPELMQTFAQKKQPPMLKMSTWLA